MQEISRTATPCLHPRHILQDPDSLRPPSGKQFKNIIIQYLENFTKIPRFSTLVLFLSRAEKGVAKQVWTLLGVGQPVGAWHPVA